MPAIGRSCISSATRRRRKAPRPPSTMSPSPHPAWTPMPSGSRRRMLPSKPASCPGPSATRSSWPIPTASKSSCSSTPRTRHAGRQSRGHRRPPPAPARPSANRRRPGAAMLPQQRRERRASGALAMAAPPAIAGWRLVVALPMALLLASMAALVAGHGGTQRARAVRIVSRHIYAGAWEYLVDDAIFTTPPYGEFGGAALIRPDGTLVGIGSLMLSEVASGVPGNMFVPTDRLKPILADMVRNGPPSAAPKPWLGINTQDLRGQLFVPSVSPAGPAAHAAVKENDIVLSVHGQAVLDLPDLYRKLWAEGPAGTKIPLTFLKGRTVADVPIDSVDRMTYLRLNPTY